MNLTYCIRGDNNKRAANMQRRFAFSCCRGSLLYLSELSDRFPDTRWWSRGPVIVKSRDVYCMERGSGALACLVCCTAATLRLLLQIKKKENHLSREWEERRVDWVLWGYVDHLFIYNCMSAGRCKMRASSVRGLNKKSTSSTLCYQSF